MLVLSRKKGEEILIGDDIVVTIHRLSGNRVSLGIRAPNDYRIVRGELCLDEKGSQPAQSDAAKSASAKEPSVATPTGAGRTNRIAEHLSQTLRLPR